MDSGESTFQLMRRYMKHFLVATLISVVSITALADEMDELLARVKQGRPDAVSQAYRLLSTSKNAEESEALFMALESTVDIDPNLLLQIRGIDFERFCGGIEYDLTDPTNEALVKKQVEDRIRRINSTNLSPDVKQHCLKKLDQVKLIPACLKSQDCYRH